MSVSDIPVPTPLRFSALEEIGKLLFTLWGVPEPKKNRHVAKQRAVAALLTAEWVNKEFGHHETLDEELIERGAKAISESAPGRFGEFVEMIVVDKSKHAALYSDEWSADLDPDFARGAGTLIDMVIRAIGAITRDPTAMERGSLSWRHDAHCTASRLGGEMSDDPHRHHSAAFDMIASTLPLGSNGCENGINANGERLIWLLLAVVDRLKALRGPGETSSDVILRLAPVSDPGR